MSAVDDFLGALDAPTQAVLGRDVVREVIRLPIEEISGSVR